jgi:hypothetical protein
MSIATPSPSTLIAATDLVFPSTGTIGYVILLKPDLLTATATVNISNGIFTTASPHKLVTGSRVRSTSTGTIPTPIITTLDYYAIVVSPTTLKLATTLANAQSNAPLALSGTSTGTLTISEQPLASTDPISVLINKELSATNGYVRMPISNVGTASLINGLGQKNAAVTLTNTGSGNIDYIAVLVAFGINNSIGSIVGVTSYYLDVESTTQTTLPNEIRSFNLAMELASG